MGLEPLPGCGSDEDVATQVERSLFRLLGVSRGVQLQRFIGIVAELLSKAGSEAFRSRLSRHESFLRVPAGQQRNASLSAGGEGVRDVLDKHIAVDSRRE